MLYLPYIFGMILMWLVAVSLWFITHSWVVTLPLLILSTAYFSWLMVIKKIEYDKLVRRITARTEGNILAKTAVETALNCIANALSPFELPVLVNTLPNSWQHRRVFAYALRKARIYSTLTEGFKFWDSVTYRTVAITRLSKAFWPQW